MATNSYELFQEAVTWTDWRGILSLSLSVSTPTPFGRKTLHPNQFLVTDEKQPYMYMILMMYHLFLLRYVDSSLTFCHGLMQHV
jgi:hypothetical protein